jgi:hypothetical protein
VADNFLFRRCLKLWIFRLTRYILRGTPYMAIQEENSGKRPRHNFVATIIVMCKRVKLKNIFDQTVYLAWHFHSFPFLGFSFCWTTVERQFNKQRKQIFCFRVRHQLIFCHFIEMDNFSNFDVSYKRVFLKKPFVTNEYFLKSPLGSFNRALKLQTNIHNTFLVTGI